MPNPFSKLQSHSLPGNLFASVVNDSQIIIESRTNEKKHFSTFDLKSGNLILETTSQTLTPWHSLVGIKNQYLIIQYFENKKNPDLASHFLYNQQTDEMMDELNYFSNTTQFSIPTLYLSESPDFPLFQQFIDQKIVLGCEYQEYGNKIIMSYYLQVSNEYIRRLRILVDRKAVYDEVQDYGLKGFAPGSFFTFKNRLIFAQNKKEFNIYEI